MQRLLVTCVHVLGAALLFGGCGDPQTVTYVDPNDPAPAAGSGEGAPAAAHGPHVLARARAVEHVRAGLTAARSLAATDPAAARSVVRRVLEDDVVTIEPRLHATSPRLAKGLRSSLEQIASGDVGAASLPSAIVRADRQWVEPAGQAAVPASARMDTRFRGMVLHESLQDASTSYEEAFDGGTQLVAAEAYEVAYGLILNARTRQVVVLPEPIRASIRGRLQRVARDHLASAVPPREVDGTEAVSGVLGVITDDVAAALMFDPSYPSPQSSATGQLDALKRAIAEAVEAARRGQRAAALRKLAIADRRYLGPASASIASVTPELLVELERGLLVTLPDAIRAGRSPDAIVIDLDAAIDECTALVTEEIELQREAGE